MLKEKVYKNCQSCGIPSKRDPMRGGTNTDGSKSTMYCSQCYINGVFVNSEINTAEKMQALVKSKLKDMGFPGLLAWFFTMNIPKLRRWSGV